MAFSSFTAAAAKVVLGVDSTQMSAGLHAAEAEFATGVARIGGQTAELAERSIRAKVALDQMNAAILKFGRTMPQAEMAMAAYIREQRKLVDLQRTGAASMQRFERGMVSSSLRAGGFGRALTFASNAFLGGAGLVMALHSAIDASQKFQGEMVLLQTQALKTHGEVVRMSKAVLDIAPALATGPMELAKGLYRVESAGYQGAKALDILKTAAKGARLGHADLESTTTALVSAQKSGIQGARDLGQAMGTLDAIVGAGNMRMEDLTKALASGVVPAARQFGLSLQDLGGALDVLTVQGTPAELAATRLRYTIALLGAQTPKAAKELQQIGITSTQLGHVMRTQGLYPALELLNEKLKTSGKTWEQQSELLVRAYGGGRSSTTILTLIQNLDMLRKKTQLIQNQGTNREFQGRWLAQMATAEYQFARLRSIAETTKIRLGNILMPTAVEAAKGISNWLAQAHNQVRLQRDVTEGFHDAREAAQVFGNALHQVGTVMHDLDTILGGTGKSLKVLLELLLLKKAVGFTQRFNNAYLNPLRSMTGAAKDATAALTTLDHTAGATAGLQRMSITGGSQVLDEAIAGIPVWRQQDKLRELEAQQQMSAAEQNRIKAAEGEAAAVTQASMQEQKARIQQMELENRQIAAIKRNAALRGASEEEVAQLIKDATAQETETVEAGSARQQQAVDRVTASRKEANANQPRVDVAPYEQEQASAEAAAAAVRDLAAARKTAAGTPGGSGFGPVVDKTFGRLDQLANTYPAFTEEELRAAKQLGLPPVYTKGGMAYRVTAEGKRVRISRAEFEGRSQQIPRGAGGALAFPLHTPEQAAAAAAKGFLLSDAEQARFEDLSSGRTLTEDEIREWARLQQKRTGKVMDLPTARRMIDQAKEEERTRVRTSGSIPGGAGLPYRDLPPVRVGEIPELVWIGRGKKSTQPFKGGLPHRANAGGDYYRISDQEAAQLLAQGPGTVAMTQTRRPAARRATPAPRTGSATFRGRLTDYPESYTVSGLSGAGANPLLPAGLGDLSPFEIRQAAAQAEKSAADTENLAGKLRDDANARRKAAAAASTRARAAATQRNAYIEDRKARGLIPQSLGYSDLANPTTPEAQKVAGRRVVRVADETAREAERLQAEAVEAERKAQAVESEALQRRGVANALKQVAPPVELPPAMLNQPLGQIRKAAEQTSKEAAELENVAKGLREQATARREVADAATADSKAARLAKKAYLADAESRGVKVLPTSLAGGGLLAGPARGGGGLDPVRYAQATAKQAAEERKTAREAERAAAAAEKEAAQRRELASALQTETQKRTAAREAAAADIRQQQQTAALQTKLLLGAKQRIEDETAEGRVVGKLREARAELNNVLIPKAQILATTEMTATQARELQLLESLQQKGVTLTAEQTAKLKQLTEVRFQAIKVMEQEAAMARELAIAEMQAAEAGQKAVAVTSRTVLADREGAPSFAAPPPGEPPTPRQAFSGGYLIPRRSLGQRFIDRTGRVGYYSSGAMRGLGNVIGEPQTAMGTGMMLTVFGDQIGRALPGSAADAGASKLLQGAGAGMLFGSMILPGRYGGLLGGAVGSSFALKSIIGGRPGSGRRTVGNFVGNIGEGAALGAAVGSVVPVLGTGVGAGAGAALGLGKSLIDLMHHADNTSKAMLGLANAAQKAGQNVAAARQLHFEAGVALANDRVNRDQAKDAVAAAKAEYEHAKGTDAAGAALNRLRAAQANYRSAVRQVISDEKAQVDSAKEITHQQEIQRNKTTALVNKILDLGRQAEKTGRDSLAGYGRWMSKAAQTTQQARAAANSFAGKMDDLAAKAKTANPQLARTAIQLANIARQTGKLPKNPFYIRVILQTGIDPRSYAQTRAELEGLAAIFNGVGGAFGTPKMFQPFQTPPPPKLPSQRKPPKGAVHWDGSQWVNAQGRPIDNQQGAGEAYAKTQPANAVWDGSKWVYTKAAGKDFGFPVANQAGAAAAFQQSKWAQAHPGQKPPAGLIVTMPMVSGTRPETGFWVVPVKPPTRTTKPVTGKNPPSLTWSVPPLPNKYVDPQDFLDNYQYQLAVYQATGRTKEASALQQRARAWLMADLKHANTRAEAGTISRAILQIGSAQASAAAKSISGKKLLNPTYLEQYQQAYARGNVPGEIAALTRQRDYLRKQADHTTGERHRKYMTLLDETVRQLNALNKKVAGGATLAPKADQIRVANALLAFEKGGGGNVDQLKKQRQIVADYLAEKGHTPAQRKTAEKRLAELNRQIRSGGTNRYETLIAAYAKEQHDLEQIAKHAKDVDTRLKATQQAAAIQKKIDTLRKQEFGSAGAGVSGLGLSAGQSKTWLGLQDKLFSALRTKGTTKDDIAAYAGEKKFLQQIYNAAKSRHDLKVAVAANKLLASIDAKMAKLVGSQNEMLKKLEQQFLAEQRSFYSQFASNEFTPGPQITVHHNYPHGPTQDQSREAMLTRHSYGAAFD